MNQLKFIFIISIWVFVLTACETQQQRDQKAIHSVFEQIYQSSHELSENIDAKKMDWYKAQQLYRSQLSNIDLLECPADFQSAFLDYLDTYSDTVQIIHKRQQNQWTYGFFDALHVLGSVVGLSKEATPFINQKDEHIERFEAAFMEMKKVALRYGVQYKSE